MFIDFSSKFNRFSMFSDVILQKSFVTALYGLDRARDQHNGHAHDHGQDRDHDEDRNQDHDMTPWI